MRLVAFLKSLNVGETPPRLADAEPPMAEEEKDKEKEKGKEKEKDKGKK